MERTLLIESRPTLGTVTQLATSIAFWISVGLALTGAVSLWFLLAVWLAAQLLGVANRDDIRVTRRPPGWRG